MRAVSSCSLRQRLAQDAEYSPRTIKKAITGNGGAEKSQVEYMIRMILSLGATVKPSDAFDALGVAVCDFYHSGARSIALAAGKAGS